MCATDQVLPCSLIRSTSWVSAVSSKISERIACEATLGLQKHGI